jgi:type IV pilus assembly protein PilM
MGFTIPFANGDTRKKRAQIIAVDLGSRTTKAVLLERRGELLALTRFALLDAPIVEKKISPELLADHLHNVAEALGGNVKYIAAAVGLGDALVRQVELPQMPLDELRAIVKMNHKNYLQQDLPNHAFDCYIIPPRLNDKPEDGKAVSAAPKKLKVLAAAAKQQIIADFMQAAKAAGLVPDALVPGLLGPINAFEKAQPDIFAKEAVALVDIGFKHTSVCVLDRGELATSRTINIGGDQITAGLSEAMSISYAEAEGIKVGMAPEIEVHLQSQVVPLGREIRASLDFFEHQQDRPVSEIYLSGGSTRSEMILQILRSELLVECKTWNPTGFLQLALPGQQAVEIDHIGPQLTVAIGTALAIY